MQAIIPTKIVILQIDVDVNSQKKAWLTLNNELEVDDFQELCPSHTKITCYNLLPSQFLHHEVVLVESRSRKKTQNQALNFSFSTSFLFKAAKFNTPLSWLSY